MNINTTFIDLLESLYTRTAKHLGGAFKITAGIDQDRPKRPVQTLGNCAPIAMSLAARHGCKVPSGMEFRNSALKLERDFWGKHNSMADRFVKLDKPHFKKEHMRFPMVRKKASIGTRAEVDKDWNNLWSSASNSRPPSSTGHYLVIRSNGEGDSHVSFEHRDHGELNYGINDKVNFPIVGRIPLERSTSGEHNQLRGCYCCGSKSGEGLCNSCNKEIKREG